MHARATVAGERRPKLLRIVGRKELDEVPQDPPPPPAMNDLLAEYLREELEDRRKGFTLEGLYKAHRDNTDWQNSHEAKDNIRFDELKGLVTAIAASQQQSLDRMARVSDRVAKLEAAKRDADDSGSHMRTKLDSFDMDLENTEKLVQRQQHETEKRFLELKSEFEGKLAAKELALVHAENAKLAAEKKESSTRVWAFVTGGFLLLASGAGVVIWYLITHGR